jgi:hypothetical protein
MALRIGSNVVKGEIDNRAQGRVVGTLWVEGCPQPVQLDLTGDCLRDAAGCRFSFTCKGPQPMKHPEYLNPEQKGVVGDMTISRKVKAFVLPMEEALALYRAGKKAETRLANCLYLEWYSEANGRVVIETTDFSLTSLSDQAWRMTAEEDRQQREKNVEAIGDFMEQVNTAIEAQRDPWSPDDDTPMDEFEWERELRESDDRTDKYGKLIEKYDDHPDAEHLIAREMGWDRLDDLLDADERGVFDEEKSAMAEEEDWDPLEPNAATEGVDWIRTGDGRIKHPLARRSQEASVAVWQRCKALGLLGEDGDEDVADLAFQAHMLSAKLAGALNGLAYRTIPDPGFVVAYLKRALTFFDGAMAAALKVEEKGVLDEALLRDFRQEWFGIREDALALMERYREET